jgi:glycerol kinase
MRSTDLILAIDQGTGSSKALLVDATGEILARGSAPLSIAHPRRGWVEQSPHEIWASVEQAVAQCLAGHDRSAVGAIGISSQRESLLLWDRATGEPLSSLVTWQDRRTAEQCRALLERGAGELVRTRSGLPLDPMFSATKATWLLDAYDPDRSRSRRGELCLGTVDSWLVSRFADEHVIEIGNASRTQLLDVRRGEWDDELLDLFGVPREVLPRIMASTGPFPPARGIGPLAGGVPVAAVLGDSHAALFAHGGWLPGRVKATYGTGSSVMSLCPADVETPAGLCLTIAWRTDTTAWALEGNIRSSGSTLSWLSGVVGRTPAELADLASAASSDGVHLVPAFNGLGAPWWDDAAQGTLTGLTLGTQLAQVARAALESIAFQVEDVVAAVECAIGPVTRLDADGGASGNLELMQLQADLGGRSVHRAHTAELSPLGAAHLAGLATGRWDLEALEALPRPATVLTPELPPAARAERLVGWHDAVAMARMTSTTAQRDHHDSAVTARRGSP